MADTTAFITLENISKQFPGVLALDNVNLTLRKGEVHCLAGQNGCGKSTIIKVISGVYHPEKGAQILLDGKLFHHLTIRIGDIGKKRFKHRVLLVLAHRASFFLNRDKANRDKAARAPPTPQRKRAFAKKRVIGGTTLLRIDTHNLTD